MTFGKAIEEMKNGKQMARRGWNGKGQYIELATSISYVNAAGEVILTASMKPLEIRLLPL